MKQGIVLFGHGSRNPEWVGPFHAIQREIEAQEPAAGVELAFLELMQPDLAEAITRLVARGAERVVIVPVFISAGSHVREDLPRLIADALRQHPGLEVKVAAALGEAPAMLQAMASYAVTALSDVS